MNTVTKHVQKLPGQNDDEKKWQNKSTGRQMECRMDRWKAQGENEEYLQS